ncbi:hypothetical protein SKAU_G00373820 [Synaphobranchus kaupii]|uniref:Uncharacterized protein n=1 Tax=Synaphobranchus kaupii TaxID=118154 RepID=A0A9Q1IG82_SYNKA|nr:hypothetical protein SKAU_G00373820 [Synaphobranchus kaupii]
MGTSRDGNCQWLSKYNLEVKEATPKAWSSPVCPPLSQHTYSPSSLLLMGQQCLQTHGQGADTIKDHSPAERAEGQEGARPRLRPLTTVAPAERDPRRPLAREQHLGRGGKVHVAAAPPQVLLGVLAGSDERFPRPRRKGAPCTPAWLRLRAVVPAQGL